MLKNFSQLITFAILNITHSIQIDPNEFYRTYLDLFKIDDNRYIIGVHQKGITVYNQQIRSLNIFYALHRLGTLKEPKQIAVIGAGVAGLTFAAAALKAGHRVILIERESVLMHLQFGCFTREIHPNLYDWPETNSIFPYARLPILSWRYNRASNVSSQIVTEFKSITKKYENNYREERNSYFEIDKSYKGVDLRIKIAQLNFEKTIDENSLFRSKFVDIVIYATGYGIEKGVETGTPSYWRNDDFGQPTLSTTTGALLNKKRQIWISGVGDGGLIDLFRLKIRGYSLDALYKEVLQKFRQYPQLKEKLLEIRQEWIELTEQQQVIEPYWLYKKFDGVYPRAC